MEPHSWIYIIATLAYLYFLSQIVDRQRLLFIRRSRIGLPKGDRKTREKWLNEMRALKRDTGSFKRLAIILFFIIPAIEIAAHFVAGQYIFHDKLLSIILFAVFFLGLLVILFAMKGKSVDSTKKYIKDRTIQFD